MTHDERLIYIQGLNDRLLYLGKNEREQFLKYIETLYEIYPVPRPVWYGKDIKKDGEPISV